MASYPIGSFYGNIGVKSFPALSSAWAYLCAPRSDFKRSQTLQHLPSSTLEVNPRHPERHVRIHVQMHSSCPTSCPDHLSQTLTINPTEEEFDGSSELKVSSVIIDLLNKEKKYSSPFSVTLWGRRSTWKPGQFEAKRGKIGRSCVCQPGGGLKNPPLGHLLYSLFPCCFDLAFTPLSMCARALSGQQGCIMIQTKGVGVLFMNY